MHRALESPPPAMSSTGALEGRGLARWAQQLFVQVDITPLVRFRIAFGVIMLWEVGRYFVYNWIFEDFVQPEFFFTYYGFSWVHPWPGPGMYIHFALLGVCAMAIALGLFYRVATILFFLGFTYVFLIDQARYLNHFYLVCLYSFLLMFVPAHHSVSLDARWRPRIKSGLVPAWSLWVLRAQICVVYLMGGIAKLSSDWLQGEPMRLWLHQRTAFPVIGRFFHHEWMVYAFSYSGLLFDLLIVPMVLWRRTRALAFGLAVIFNLMNAQLFQIGIFPWLTLGATVLLFAGSGTGSWQRFLGPSHTGGQSQASVPLLGGMSRAQSLTALLLAGWLAFQ